MPTDRTTLTLIIKSSKPLGDDPIQSLESRRTVTLSIEEARELAAAVGTAWNRRSAGPGWVPVVKKVQGKLHNALMIADTFDDVPEWVMDELVYAHDNLLGLLPAPPEGE
jgi:hypothetical protein